MGFYNVVKPCVVGKLHHVRPTTAPIEVDDATAAPLVASGCLEPYSAGGVSVPAKPPEPEQTVGTVEAEPEPVLDPEPEPQRRPRARRGSED